MASWTDKSLTEAQDDRKFKNKSSANKTVRGQTGPWDPTGGGAPSGGAPSGGGGGGGGGGGKTTTHTVTTKGNKYEAKNFERAAKVLGKQLEASQRKLKNFDKQYKSARKQIDQKLERDSALLRESQAASRSNYIRQLFDNDAAESDTSFSNLANQRRERQQSLQQVLSQGGGETDMLKAQQMALRNWSANQQEINRSYSDTLSSINTAISDTDMQNAAAFHNLAEEALSDHRNAWNETQQSKGTALAEMAELYANQSNALAQARDASVTKVDTSSSTGTDNVSTTQYQTVNSTKKSKRYKKDMQTANKNLIDVSNQVADLNAETFDAEGHLKTREELGYESTADNPIPGQEETQNMNQIGNAQRQNKLPANEGATVRRF